MPIAKIQGQINLNHLLQVNDFIVSIANIRQRFPLIDIDYDDDDQSTISGQTDHDSSMSSHEDRGSIDEFVITVHGNLKSGMPFLSSVGMAYLKTLTNKDFRFVVDHVDDLKQTSSESQQNLLIQFEQILTFSRPDRTPIKLASIDASFIAQTNMQAQRVALDVMLGLGLIIRSIPIRTTLADTAPYDLAAAIQSSKCFTASNHSYSPIVRFELCDLIDILNNHQTIGKLDNAKILKRLDPQKSTGRDPLWKLLDSDFYKNSCADTTSLFTISAGYGIFAEKPNIERLLNVIKQIYHNKMIMYVSDHWHSYTYDALSIYQSITEYSKTKMLPTESFLPSEQKQANFDRALQEGDIFLSEYASHMSTIGSSRLIERSSDFDLATRFIIEHSAPEGVFGEQFPSFSDPDEILGISDRNRIKSLQLAYVIYLTGKLAFLTSDKQSKSIDKFHLPHLSPEELTEYKGLINLKLNNFKYYHDFIVNAQFTDMCKKIYNELTSSSLFIFGCTERFSFPPAPSLKELSPFIFDDPQAHRAFYTAQQLSCRYSIYTMSLIITYGLSNNLRTQCYPGHASGYVDGIIKLIQQCGDMLNRALSPRSSPGSSPPRLKKQKGTVEQDGQLQTNSLFIKSSLISHQAEPKTIFNA